MDNLKYLKIAKAADLENPKERAIFRFFEILPGLLAWTTLILLILLSFVFPVFVAVFIILFDVYWLVKTVYLSLYLRIAFKKLRKNMQIDWKNELELLDPRAYTLKSIKHWSDTYHLIIFPMYKESRKTVALSFESLLRADYPLSKFIVALATEERAGAEARETAEYIKKTYGNRFFKFIVTSHPADIKGELAGKGANAAWAAREVKNKVIDTLKIPYEKIIVSNFDIDTAVMPRYFSRLTHAFLTSPDPLRSSYQPVPFYTNNIWEAPAFARVVAFSSTFWHTLKQEKIESDTTFSSHSMPFKALVGVDFWQTNMVSEDSRIFWQCFLRYDGDYKVTPLLYPVSMDANVAVTFWQTLKNVYKQQRRWGYGVENVPYFIFAFIKNKKISFKKKFYYTVTMLERFHSWATNAIMIFLLGWFPVFVGGSEFNQTVLSFNLPSITRLIMAFAMLGIITSAILTIAILPPRPLNYGRAKHALMVLQWALLPATMIGLGSIPGLEAQTRLMLGKYMGFWVTPKGHRTKSAKGVGKTVSQLFKMP